jgi:hypothetical protein
LAANAHVSELLAAFALGALEPQETEIVVRHLQNCPHCRAELEGYQAVTELLPYAAPAHPVPVRARAALLSRVDAIGTQNPEQLVMLQPERRAGRGQLRRVPRLAWAAGSLAAVVLIAFTVSSFLMQDRIQDQQQQLEAEREKQGDIAEVLLDQRYETQLTGSTAAPDAEGKLLVNLADNSALLLVKSLPPPEDGASYTVWLHIQGEYARVGVLDVQDDGRGSLVVRPPDRLSHYTMLVITAEVDPNSALPTGPEVLTASLLPQSNFDRFFALTD